MEEEKDEILVNNLFDLTMEKKWIQVTELYSKHPSVHKAKLTKNKNTALHVAVLSYNSSESPVTEKCVKEMIKHMSIEDLSIGNAKEDTPLHLAAAVGWTEICGSIAEKHWDLITKRNEMNETPLFVAARYGKNKAFILLHEIYLQKAGSSDESESGYSLCRRNDGNTALHAALSGEEFGLANKIISYYPKLVDDINLDGESPLHVLAKKPAIFKNVTELGFLDSLICNYALVELHQGPEKTTTTSTQHFEFPKKYRKCVNIFHFFWTPLLSITRASLGRQGKQQNVYPKDEGSQQLGREKESKGNALVELHQGPRKITTSTQDFEFPKNYRTCVDIFRFFWIPLRGIFRASLGRPPNGNPKDEESQPLEREKGSKGKARRENDVDYSYPPNYTTFILLLKFAINIILTIVGVGLGKIKKIEREKKKYRQALDIISTMLKQESSYKYVNDGQQPFKNALTKLQSQRIQPPPMAPPSDDDDDPRKPEAKSDQPRILAKAGTPFDSEAKAPSHVLAKADTPFIVAAKKGIPDMVEIILNKLHIAVYDQDSMGRNVIMLAAKHRQIAVFNRLLSTNLIPEHVFHQVDKEGNNIIHLAAMLEERDKPRRIPGAALQMQWEIKWFEYVKNSVPSICFTHHINANGETPEEIFTQKHENLMQNGYTWLIKTSESCSVIAALIAGAAFATSSSVPGGTNDDTGRPILEGEVAFDVFSISSLIGLCLAVTALVFFLAIITSRCVEKDFKSDLPSKLLNGLTCLFISIVAMLVAYCAGHTFVLKDQLKFAEIPIYAIACVPVSLYALAQLPLYADLVRASSQ